MDAEIFDDFELDVQNNPRIAGLIELPVLQPADVVDRYDVFRHHRDRSSRNITGLLFSWPSPAYLLYDWYQGRNGMTVGLETMSSISRVRTSLITLRVRHHNAEFDRSTLRVGRTFSIHPSDPSSHKVRLTILNAIAEGVSPLWRLRTAIDLPDWVECALVEPMDRGDTAGYLDKQLIEAFLALGFIEEVELMELLGARKSTYRPFNQ